MELYAYKGSLCELKTESNYFLGSGFVSKVTDEYIEVQSKQGDMPILQANLRVKIYLYNEEAGNIVVMGTVYLSTRDFARIIDVRTLSEYEKRSFYRVEILKEAMVFLLHKDPEKDQDGNTIWRVVDSFAAMIFDISLGGAQIRTSRLIPENSYLRFGLDINGTIVEYNCVVRRRRELKKGIFQYGCEFYECPSRDLDKLSRFIIAKQRELIRRNRND
ncbi:MAG TPA: PilZ domain-containing protein [Clostridiales bacterium]|nr:PilZ domain-containing protein [Clostridiales bacterium]